MSATMQPMAQPREAGLFHFLIAKQTYRNLAYLLLAFPLGLGYFIFLVTGFSLGFGMAITLLGLPILVAMLAATWGLAAFERYLANELLDAQIPAMPFMPDGPGFGARVKRLLTSGTTWKGLLYLFLDFPLGIAAFVAETVLFSLSLGLTFLPFYYQWADVYYAPYHKVDTFLQSLLFVPVGIMLFPLALLILNGFASFYRTLARTLLGPA
jgi:hypothetical protein